jgi:hypothetical protein
MDSEKKKYQILVEMNFTVNCQVSVTVSASGICSILRVSDIKSDTYQKLVTRHWFWIGKSIFFFWTHNSLTRGNYNVLTNLRTPNFSVTAAHFCVFTSRCLVTVPKNQNSSVFFLTALLARYDVKNIISNSSLIVICVSIAADMCLPCRCLVTAFPFSDFWAVMSQRTVRSEVVMSVLGSGRKIFFFCKPCLFAICTGTFSKWGDKEACRGVPNSTPPLYIGAAPRVADGTMTY